jgi:hypothetical protein
MPNPAMPQLSTLAPTKPVYQKLGKVQALPELALRIHLQVNCLLVEKSLEVQECWAYPTARMKRPSRPEFLKEPESNSEWKPAQESQRFLASAVADRRYYFHHSCRCYPSQPARLPLCACSSALPFPWEETSPRPPTDAAHLAPCYATLRSP